MVVSVPAEVELGLCVVVVGGAWAQVILSSSLGFLFFHSNSNGGFHKLGYPKMHGLSWKIRNILLKWMILLIRNHPNHHPECFGDLMLFFWMRLSSHSQALSWCRYDSQKRMAGSMMSLRQKYFVGSVWYVPLSYWLWRLEFPVKNSIQCERDIWKDMDLYRPGLRDQCHPCIDNPSLTVKKKWLIHSNRRL